MPTENPFFADGIDSHYQAVKARILAQNPDRKVFGFANAQDWPPQDVKLESFYLLALGDSPAPMSAGSISIPQVSHLVQWVWIVKGTDLRAGQRGGNRADRFKTDQRMRGELYQALYPNFAEKLHWTMSDQGVWTGASNNPVEYVIWTRATTMPKLDVASGLVYGAVSVRIADMLPQILA